MFLIHVAEIILPSNPVKEQRNVLNRSIHLSRTKYLETNEKRGQLSDEICSIGYSRIKNKI